MKEFELINLETWIEYGVIPFPYREIGMYETSYFREVNDNDQNNPAERQIERWTQKLNIGFVEWDYWKLG